MAKNNKRKIPDFIVGSKKMSWDEYWRMIKVMENTQKPFKNWIKEALLPAYKKFLKQEKRKSSDFRVAEVFFERALWLGFVNLDHIRPEFITEEFPHWWQTHVIGIDLSGEEIKSSLKRLFQFIKVTYGFTKNGLNL